MPSEKRIAVLVGKSRIPVLVISSVFRRTIRNAAQVSVAGHLDRRPASRAVEAQKLLLQQTYQRALLHVLTLAQSGEYSTTGVLNCFAERKSAGERSSIPWESMRDQQRTLLSKLKKDARLKRIVMYSEQCEDAQIVEGVQEFEDSIELQARLMQITPTKCVATLTANLDCHVGETEKMVRSPIPWCETDPPLVFGHNGGFFGRSSIHPRDLTHVLALGGTGVGKTESITKPAVAAALTYKLSDGTRAAVLVIDPKSELIEKIRSVLQERGEMDRLFIVGQHPPTQMFDADCQLSQGDRYQKLKAYVPNQGPGQNEYWTRLGEAMVLDFMQLEELYAKRTGNQRLMATLAKELKLNAASRGGYWQALRDVLSHSCNGPQKLKATSALLRRYCKAAGIESPSVEVMQTYTGANDLIEQWCYLVMSAQATITALANPDLEKFVDFDILGITHQARTDISALVEDGMVVLFCPQPKRAHDIAGKALKERFYEASLSRKNLRRGVFIVIDEFHRFVTDDARSQSSEANFIDICRAFRVNVFFATQALGSIKRALGGDAAAQNTVDVICQNTPTKAIFRCSDADTVT